ncbi:MAG: GNAT family N-acetyltransferase [Candidatus Bathyarchaeia archaeon]
MPLEIIRASQKDVDRVAPLFDQYREFYKERADAEGARSFLMERLTKNESVVFLAVDRELGAVGFIQLYPSFSSVSMKRLWILNDLFVLPAARKRGVGEALLQRAEEFARQTNAKGLELETWVNNLPAQHLYEKCGWKRNVEFYQYMLYL